MLPKETKEKYDVAYKNGPFAPSEHMHPRRLSDSPFHVTDVTGKPENWNSVNARKANMFGIPWSLESESRVTEGEPKFPAIVMVMADPVHGLSLSLSLFYLRTCLEQTNYLLK